MWRRAGLILLAIPILYLFAALIGALWPAGGDAHRKGPVTVHLIAGPIHYDLLLPLDGETRARFAEMDAPDLPLSHPGARWLIVGWGAKAFYTTTGTYKDVSLDAVLKAIFGDSSVLRVDLTGPLPADLETTRIAMDKEHYIRLLDAIGDSFARDREGRVIALDHPGFSGSDMFFEARGRFNLLRTCNSWVGSVLREAGLPFGAWTPTPFAVTLAHRLHMAKAPEAAH
ncbi:TIGR02117 family protein [Thalassococcus sp. S3]|uniref:TIGR02117 family protein n=1 Tax=Thalassococcus sp. S3 TaxID=2017482 RepID=UPI0013EE81D2|nr:TIGR02117 family protein [Thalassococcus sp. S3]